MIQIQSNQIISNAKSVLDMESKSLAALSESINENFIKAVEILNDKNSRIVVSGIGKSGLVGRKIAATLSSTGQPAFFVHPSEASHGDLGMITKGDKLLLISNSGETKELQSIIDYAKRFEIAIVAITSKANSTLAKVADVAIILPNFPEACPMGLAPTTSTTMTLALGDALAVCILSSKNFTSTDFQIFHPGGNLGNQIAKVSDYMHKGKSIPLTSIDTKMDDCLIKISYFGFGCMGILDHNDKLIGVITDGDLRRNMQKNLLEKTVQDIMNKQPTIINQNVIMAEALSIMQKKSITSLFVVDENLNNLKPIGILHIHDCLRAGIV